MLFGNETRLWSRHTNPVMAITDLDGIFLQMFRTDLVPHNTSLIMLGPFCPSCHTVVSEKVGQELAAMLHGGSASGLLALALPCMRSGYQVSEGLPTKVGDCVSY